MFDALLKSCEKYKITEGNRLNYFLAQCAHESMGFSKIEECLNYSAEALLKLWPKRFTPEEAAQYARWPSAIANKIYANRMGNGDEESGDGWRYRGAWFMQLTGKNMQQKCVDALSSYVGARDARTAIDSACWFWSTINGNDYADKNDFEGLTKAINGGLNGLEDRLNWLNKIAATLIDT